MLTLLGPAARFCDGISRRSFLKIGTFAFGATQLSLADMLRAEERTGRSSSHKAVINICLPGGPPHQDMWDLKPDAPAEIRGEFKPINTNVSGIQIGECFPKIAAMMDKFAVIRSIIGARGGHDLVQCTTGREPGALRAMGGWPSIGSLLSKVAGPVDPSVPPFIGLSGRTGHMPWSDEGKPGFLGSSFAAFMPDGPGMTNMRLNTANRDRFADRKTLLAGFDQLKRDLDSSDALRGADSSTKRAMDVLLSSKLVDALDISKEPERVRDRYGDGKPYKYQFDGAPTVNDHLLAAPVGGSRGPLRDAELRPLGQPRQELRSRPRPRRQARSMPQRTGRRPRSARHVGRCHGDCLGRIRANAADQQGRRPRPLAAGELCHSCRGRDEDRSGDRQHEPPGRNREGSADRLPGRIRYSLEQPGLRSGTDDGE